MLDFFGFFFFFETKPSRNVGLFSFVLFFLFSFFWKQSNAKLDDECQTSGIGEVRVF